MKLSDKNIFGTTFEQLEVSSFWSTSEEKEDRMHKIHSYPAKFPAFLVSKAITYAERKNVSTSKIGDIFCGCGTTALESSKLNKEFFGWDINPVATLIAKVKSSYYQENRLINYFNQIIDFIESKQIDVDDYYLNHNRISYWFPEKNIKDLYSLLQAILREVPEGKYQDFFLCGFSNILKGCSVWLTKSIKPQVDPNKAPDFPQEAFKNQF